MPAFENTSIVEWLRRILLDWDLSTEKMALLTHTPEQVLTKYFSMSEEAAHLLPSVPEGLENTVPFISIYKRLKEKFPGTEEQVKWLFTEHADFGNNKPIDVIAQTQENLSWVSYYLESSR